MIYEIGKNINRNQFSRLVCKYLVEEKDNQAYERSLYYILNSTRRGGFLVKEDKGIFIFAKDYDKPNTLSLIFFSEPETMNPEVIKKLMGVLPKKEIFIHHLFERRAKEIVNSLERGEIITPKISKDKGSYLDEDTYPQLVYPIKDLSMFQESVFLKRKHLVDLLSNQSNSQFQEDILAYMNSSQREINEPEIFTIIIEKEMSKDMDKMITSIISRVLENWKKNQKDKSKDFNEYYTQPILNLVNLLKKKDFIEISESKIIFRAAFDLKINRGGFWIGEFIPKKSLLIPHVILTDYFYREQYKFLLYDIISYSYVKGFSYVNLGGCEEESLYKKKSLPKIFFDSNNFDRKVFSVYLPKQKN